MRKLFLLFVSISLLLSACSNGSSEDGFEFKKTVKLNEKTTIGDLNKSYWELKLGEESFQDDVSLTMRVVSEEERTNLESGSFTLLSAPVEFTINEQANVRLQNYGLVTIKIPDSYSKDNSYEDLFIGYYGENGWEYFLPDSINLENNTVSFHVYHFSMFGFGIPSEQDQIETFAKQIAVDKWNKQNHDSDLLNATKNQFDEVFKQIGMTGSSSERNQMIADTISFLEDSSLDSGGTSPMDALVQMANSASQGDAGKQAFTEKYIEFMGKAIMNVIERDPDAFAKQFNYSVTLSKIALAFKDGDDVEALKGVGNLLKIAVPQAQIVETTLLFAVQKGKETIDYWTANELEKAYKAYIGQGSGKYGFTDSQDFDLIFTTLGGGQRQTELMIIEKWCAERNIDPNTLGQSGKDAIVKDAYNALKAHFDLRRVKEPEILEIQKQEEAFIQALRNEGLLSPKNYKTYFQSEESFNPTLRLQKLYQLKEFVLNMIDPEVAKDLSSDQIAVIIRQWVHFNDQKDRKAFYDYLKSSQYLKPIGGNPSYAWVLVDTITFDGQKEVDSTNAGGVYNASASSAPGSYSYTWSYLGKTDTYYDPDVIHGEGATIQGNSSTPPSIIKGEEIVSLDLSISVAEDNLSYYTANGSIYADIDEWDMTPGLTTNAYEDFVNKDGKSSLKVDTYKTVQVYSASDTLTAKMPNGQNEGDKLAIRVIFYAGPSMGTNYVYEWKPVE